LRLRELKLIALPGIPEVAQGASLCDLLVAAVARAGLQLQTGDIMVLAQKIVSKAEGRAVRLAGITPSDSALDLAGITGKDARLMELVLRESRAVLRVKTGVIVVEHRLGFVMANAGIDQSNVPGDGETALLLPEDPDASARGLRDALLDHCGIETGVLIIDSFGRAWRNGVAGTAIGVAGMPALVDLRGHQDREGRTLKVTQVAVADELAAAASLIMGQAGEGTPAVLARGFPYARRAGAAGELLRPETEDLFR
jgi:coenzyme F420-0:L-glutamate ligase/coenzyme F420-1:gamma-L-glutamate ligase